MSTQQATSEVINIPASEAWQILESNKNAHIVDVRTLPEWSFIGTPDTSSLDKETILLSWRKYPTMDVNTSFTDELENTLPNKEAPILFLCRTGARSYDAAEAMIARGYTQCFNIENGFEGDMNERSQRGTTNGWKAAKLPWRQT